MSRTILITSAQDPTGAAQALAQHGGPHRVCMISPTAAARQTASALLDGHSAVIVEEPRLAPRTWGETGDDVVARLVQAFRIVQAHDAENVVVVLDRLDILGAGTFTVDPSGLMRWSSLLERLLPLP